ncbi:MAG: copper resistance CopC family protein [Microbacteriaceae bacterium]
MRIRTFASVALAALAVFGAAVPAFAHDSIDSVSPEAGSIVATAPTEIALTFTEPVIEIGNAIVVTDDTGADWASGDITVADRTVRQPLKSGMPEGVYTVTWRIVSEDGHPVSGAYVFGVGSSAELQALVTEAAEALTQPIDEDADAAQATPVAASAEDGSNLLVTIGIAIGGAAIAIALFWSALSIIRKRRQ